jgi:predicted MPP superfamily phosphohydrolase
MFKPTRREALWALGGVVLGSSSVRAMPSSEHFEVETQDIRLSTLDLEHDGLRVVQLSDLHIGSMTPDGRFISAARSVEQLAPELIVLTGDFITVRTDPVERVSQLLDLLPKVPRVAVLGNHDHWTYPGKISAELEKAGVTLLRNQHTVVWLRGAPFRVVGVDDGMTRHDDPVASFRGVPETGSQLVLTHTPSAAARMPARSAVCLAGHTHGGHFVVPGLTRSVFQVAREPWIRGWYQVGGNRLYVNRGIGAGGPGHFPRVGSVPEISAFTLRRSVANGSAGVP